MIGNPSASTTNSVTYVPGTFSNQYSFYTGEVPQVGSWLNGQDPNMVVFVWHGGEFPGQRPGTTQVDGILAANEAPLDLKTGGGLAAFQNEVATDPHLNAARHDAIAHSWGLAATTASELKGARYDNVVSLSGAWMPPQRTAGRQVPPRSPPRRASPLRLSSSDASGVPRRAVACGQHTEGAASDLGVDELSETALAPRRRAYDDGMKILLTGATGYIGSSVLDVLRAHGHDVVAPVRSAHAAQKATATGATAVVGDITDAAWFIPLLEGVDAAIHTAAPSDGTAPQFDAAVAEAVIAAFSGTGKPYIHTGGLWIHGPSDDLTEQTPFNPPAIVAWREGVESRLAAADLALTIVEPGIVHSHGAGIPAMLGSAPRDAEGRLTVIGDGTPHWATVHVDDLAELYVRVIESPEPVGRVLGLSGHNATVTELGEAVAGGPVVAEGVEASRARLGAPFADALMLDQQGSGAKARALGWTPTRPSLLEEIRACAYGSAAQG